MILFMQKQGLQWLISRSIVLTWKSGNRQTAYIVAINKNRYVSDDEKGIDWGLNNHRKGLSMCYL